MSGPVPRRSFLQSAAVAIGGAVWPAAAGARAAGRAQAPASTPLTAVTTALAAHIPPWLREAHVPGLSLVLIADGAIAWQRQFGRKSASASGPIDAATMFEAASMSKPAFAYVVMKLCETGVIALDTPLVRYTSNRFIAGDPRLDRITARHVLAHTSGFQNWRSDAAPLAIHFTPGERYMYSGEGYNYLQTVVTERLGQPFERYMHERLFVPLGMTSSCYVWDDATATRMARPHDRDGRPIDNPRSTPDSVARYGAAGALLTTAADYARFVIAVIDPPPAAAHRLRRDTIADMLRPHVAVDAGPFRSSWALGWQLFHQPRQDVLFHGGNNRGFHCAAVASLGRRTGYVAMTNGDAGPVVLQKILSDDAMQRFLTDI